jgi:hypothetical protein
MEENKIIACLKQKKILLERVYNITKQLEAASIQPDIDFGDLPQQRQVYIDRLKKCERLLSACIGELPPEDMEHVKGLLSGSAHSDTPGGPDVEYSRYGTDIRSMLGGIVAMDNEILRNTKKERDRQHRRMKEARKGKNAGAGLYNNAGRGG